MGLYKRGKTYWFTIMRDGKRVQLSADTENKKMAEERYAKTLTSVREGKWFTEAKQNEYVFSELAEEYKKMYCRQLGFKGKDGYIRLLCRKFGDLKLSQFTTMIIEGYQTSLLAKGNKPSTVNRHISTVKHMFGKAYDWQMVSETVLKHIRRVKMLKENNKRLRYLSREEGQSLIDNCQGTIKAVVITALNTGMRKGEVLSLKWENVDLKHGFILLDRTKNGERREIPINSTLRDTLQGITRRLDIPYLFYDNVTGRPYQDIKRSFNTALKKTGIVDFHFHDLRHTFASQLVMAGVDITTVSRLLGHKSLTMTLRYSHLSPGHLSKAVEAICYNFTTVTDSGRGLNAVTA